MLSPPPSRRPRPSTVILPSVLMFAVRRSMTHGWPPGFTPRTTFAAGPARTGTTPMPPSNRTSGWALAANGNVRATESRQAESVLFMNVLPRNLDCRAAPPTTPLPEGYSAADGDLLPGRNVLARRTTTVHSRAPV